MKKIILLFMFACLSFMAVRAYALNKADKVPSFKQPVQEVTAGQALELSSDMFDAPLPEEELLTSEGTQDNNVPFDEIPTHSEDFNRLISQWSYQINPAKITKENRDAHYVEFNNGIKIHVCWCYGIKVNSYSKESDYISETKEGYSVTQLPDSRNLIFKGDDNIFAYYDSEKQMTFSIVRDGLRTLRRAEYSIYIYPSGLISYVSDEGRHVLRAPWGEELTADTSKGLKITLDEILEMENTYSSLVMIHSMELGRID